jgi:DNA-binding response OmpR family regulator
MEFDPMGFTVTVALGPEVKLRPREAKLLACLMRHAGRILPRAALLRQVWGVDDERGNKTLDVHIGRLRKKLEATVSARRYIRTVRGVGYSFARLDQ